MNIGRDYSYVQARIGATDKSPSTQNVNVEIIAIEGGASKSIYNKSFAVGQYEDVKIPVTDALQLKFVFRGPLGQVYAGVADPTGFK